MLSVAKALRLQHKAWPHLVIKVHKVKLHKQRGRYNKKDSQAQDFQGMKTLVNIIAADENHQFSVQNFCQSYQRDKERQKDYFECLMSGNYTLSHSILTTLGGN